MWCEGRGNWNDDDMLEVGNKGLTIAEQRTHFALCTTQPRPAPLAHVMLACRLAVAERAAVVSGCMVKSPLLIGSDVRSIASDSLALLKNKELIA